MASPLPCAQSDLLRAASRSFTPFHETRGPNLTTDTFVRAMETMKIPPDIFGTPEATFSPTKRLGNNASRLSQIVDGKWKVISEYVQP